MAKTGFYAVANGRRVGVYQTWDECKAQTDGFKAARFKKFPSEAEARNFISDYARGLDPMKPKPYDSVPTTSGLGMGIDQIVAAALNQNGPPTSAGVQIHISMTNKSPHLNTVSPPKNSRKRGRTELDEANDAMEIAIKKSMIESTNWNMAPVVYTDGACRNNGKSHAKAGYGVWWGPDHRDNLWGPVLGEQTNNRGELTAVLKAIEQALHKQHSSLLIRTDSKLLINSLDQWVWKWKKNGWRTADGTSVKNQDLLKAIHEQRMRIAVKFEYVKAHCGIEGNEGADKLAVQGACHTNSYNNLYNSQ